MLAFLQNCCLSAGNLAEDPTLTRLVGGVRGATLVLLAVPWALVAGVALWWWRGQRRADGGSPP